jgi:hypothetical protein
MYFPRGGVAFLDGRLVFCRLFSTPPERGAGRPTMTAGPPRLFGPRSRPSTMPGLDTEPPHRGEASRRSRSSAAEPRSRGEPDKTSSRPRRSGGREREISAACQSSWRLRAPVRCARAGTPTSGRGCAGHAVALPAREAAAGADDSDRPAGAGRVLERRRKIGRPLSRSGDARSRDTCVALTQRSE